MLKLNQPIENIVLKHNIGVVLCFSKIFDRNITFSDKKPRFILLIYRSLRFFSFDLLQKKAERFFSVNLKRAKIQTMARKHTHSDQVQKVVGPITNKPSAIYNKIAQSARVWQGI